MKENKTIEGKLKEKLADIEHQRWSDWQEYCNSILREQVPKIGLEKVLERWDRQIATPYAELSEKEKDSDREQVDRYWHLIEAHTKEVLNELLEECEGRKKEIDIEIPDTLHRNKGYNTALSHIQDIIRKKLKWYEKIDLQIIWA